MGEPDNLTFKVLVLGDVSVGKSCLAFRYCEGRFWDISTATIGADILKKTVDVKGKKVFLQFWDTAGQERFHNSLPKSLYNNVHAVVFVYDITCPKSLLNLSKWIDRCSEFDIIPEKVPCIIVGNKCDMEEERAVSNRSATMFADANLMPIFETSAKNNEESDNVNSIFDTLAKLLVNRGALGKMCDGSCKLKDSEPAKKSDGCC